METTRRSFIELGSLGAAAVASIATGVPSALADETAAADAGLLEYDIPGKLSLSEIAGSAVRTDELTADEEVEADVVVVGAGTAGIPAAIAAAQGGASVVVLQKEDHAVSQGATLAFIDRETTDELGVAHLVNTMQKLFGYRSKVGLNAEWARNCTEAVEWVLGLLHDAGVDDDGIVSVPGATFEYPEGNAVVGVHAFPALGGVGGVIQTLAEGYADLIDILYSTPAVQLVREDGRVTGVFAQREDGTVLRVNAAKGVVLATGDYQNNQAMVRKYVPDADRFDRKQHGKTGDGHVMGMLVGARMQSTTHCKMVHQSNALDVFQNFKSTPFLAVNLNGKRFCAEDVEFCYRNNLVLEQPDMRWLALFDAKGPQALGESAGIEELDGKTADDGVYTADTIEGLAEAMGVPADALVATVERYNELCSSGAGDLDFGKATEYMVALDTPPYYALNKAYWLTAIMSGLEVDENSQVLDENFAPIAGLYAVGNCSGPFYGCSDYPMDVPALSTSRCVTLGYLLGNALAAL